MQTQQITQNTVVNELQLGHTLNQAVSHGHRAEFALLLAMLSQDASETTPIDKLDTEVASEAQLRVALGVNESQPIQSSQDTYQRGADIAEHFHSGGMESARLQSSLCPDALAYTAENTRGLGEDVYRNLSFHSKRQLENQERAVLDNNDMYHKLVVAHRTHQIQLSA